MIVSHTLLAQVLSAFTLPSAWSSMAHSPRFDFSLFFYFFLLSVTVFPFHLELFLELLYTKVMANLRCSAAEESEDTLNVFISPTNYPQWKRVSDKHKIKIRDASLDSQPKILSSLVREDFQKHMGQTNNDCSFWIFTLTNSLHQQRMLAGR